MSQESECARLQYQQLIEENQMMEQERTHLSGLNLTREAVTQQHYLIPRVDELKIFEGKEELILFSVGNFLVALTTNMQCHMLVQVPITSY